MPILNSVKKSWKTTVAGVIQFVTVAGGQIVTLLDNDPTTNPEWSIVVASLITLFGLFAARDGDVTSEESGLA